ncbi:MAG: acetyl-lysine deacetylase [Phycisphaerae bacterium]|nr:acetyl-lysine deacetylase [Phycisphaerae bacterium]MBM91696.1 acetyl-lysine deacetylase [Phycisphaerae bacterium]MBM92559.1 acetyl-lysine deacetylase [Phycisphaerae bacterium]
MMTNIERESLTQEAQILYDVVSQASVSGDERGAAQVFVRHAWALGLDAHIDEVGNAIALRSTVNDTQDCAVQIALLGHIDTVSGYIRVKAEGGDLYGRGSVDAKGPLCAMLVAASRAQLPEGVDLRVAGAVGEETTGSVGARHLAPRWSPDACIIGEPSGFDGVTLGYKGRLLMTARATCPNTHTAGQQRSACDQIHAFWETVLERVAVFNEGIDRAFDQIQATLRELASTSNGLEQHARLESGFRLPPALSPRELIEILHDTRDAHQGAFPELRIDLTFEGAEAAHATDRGDPVVRALSSSIRAQGHRPRPKLKTGTADLNVVAPIWKCPIAAYGPGDSALDHTPNEHINLEEYQTSIEILTRGIETLAHELLAKQREAAMA